MAPKKDKDKKWGLNWGAAAPEFSEEAKQRAEDFVRRNFANNTDEIPAGYGVMRPEEKEQSSTLPWSSPESEWGHEAAEDIKRRSERVESEARKEALENVQRPLWERGGRRLNLEEQPAAPSDAIVATVHPKRETERVESKYPVVDDNTDRLAGDVARAGIMQMDDYINQTLARNKGMSEGEKMVAAAHPYTSGKTDVYLTPYQASMRYVPSKMVDDIANSLGTPLALSNIRNNAAALNLTEEEYVKKLLLPVVENKVREELVRRKMPKNIVDAALSPLRQSIIGRILQSTAGVPNEIRGVEQEAQARYDERLKEELENGGAAEKVAVGAMTFGRMAVPFIADAGPFRLFGAVSNTAGLGRLARASALSGNGLLSTAARMGLHEGGTFGLYEGTSGLLNNIAQDDVSVWQAAKNFGMNYASGALTGFALGSVKTGLAKRHEGAAMLNKGHFGKPQEALRAGEKFAATTAVFAVSDVMKRWATDPKFDIDDVDWGDVLANSALTTMMIELAAAPDKIRAARAQKEAFGNIHFTEADKTAFRNAGIPVVRDGDARKWLFQNAELYADLDPRQQLWNRRAMDIVENKVLSVEQKNTLLKAAGLNPVVPVMETTKVSDVQPYVVFDGKGNPVTQYRVDEFDGYGTFQKRTIFATEQEAQQYREEIGEPVEQNRLKFWQQQSETIKLSKATPMAFEEMSRRGTNPQQMSEILAKDEKALTEGERKVKEEFLDVRQKLVDATETFYNIALAETAEKHGVPEEAVRGALESDSRTELGAQVTNGFMQLLDEYSQPDVLHDKSAEEISRMLIPDDELEQLRTEGHNLYLSGDAKAMHEQVLRFRAAKERANDGNTADRHLLGYYLRQKAIYDAMLETHNGNHSEAYSAAENFAKSELMADADGNVRVVRMGDKAFVVLNADMDSMIVVPVETAQDGTIDFASADRSRARTMMRRDAGEFEMHSVDDVMRSMYPGVTTERDAIFGDTKPEVGQVVETVADDQGNLLRETVAGTDGKGTWMLQGEDGAQRAVTEEDLTQMLREQEQRVDDERYFKEEVETIKAKNQEKEYENIKPVGRGVFGNIYDQFKGKAQKAVDFLLRRKEGNAVAALHHKDVGDIDLWYGNDKAGLKKIAAKHPEVLDDLQGIIDGMHVVQASENRIILESDTHRAAISKMLGNQKTDNWLLSAYEKKGTSASSSDIETEPLGKWNGTATPQNSLSGGKGSEFSSNVQENGEKSYGNSVPLTEDGHADLNRMGEAGTSVSNAIDALSEAFDGDLVRAQRVVAMKVKKLLQQGKAEPEPVDDGNGDLNAMAAAARERSAARAKLGREQDYWLNLLSEMTGRRKEVLAGDIENPDNYRQPKEIAREQIEKLAGKLGVKVVFTDNMYDTMMADESIKDKPKTMNDANQYNGYRKKDGTIVLNLNSSHALVWTMGHETGHQIEKAAPQQYEVLKAAILDTLDPRFIAEKLEHLKGQDVYSQDKENELLSEIANDGLGRIFTDERAFGELMKRLGVEEAKTLADKIKSWVGQTAVMKTLKQTWDSLTKKAQEANPLLMNGERGERLLSLAEDAYKEAMKQGTSDRGYSNDRSNSGRKWTLSEQRAENGERFFQDREGNIDLVTIPDEVFDEIGYTKAPLRLTESMVQHVRNNHGKETKIDNEQDAIDFITDVMSHFDHVRLGYDGALIFSIENGRAKTGKRAITVLLNSQSGEFYGVKTSGYEDVKRLNKRPLLWEGSATITPSTDAATESVTSLDGQRDGDQSGSASDQSKGLVVDKDTEFLGNNQENDAEFSKESEKEHENARLEEQMEETKRLTAVKKDYEKGLQAGRELNWRSLGRGGINEISVYGLEWGLNNRILGHRPNSIISEGADGGRIKVNMSQQNLVDTRDHIDALERLQREYVTIRKSPVATDEARRVIDSNIYAIDYARRYYDLALQGDNAILKMEAPQFSKEEAEPKEVEKHPIFLSNAEVAVRNIKQDKATAEQWLAMAEKMGGIKAGEDKWMGLSDWLRSKKGEKLTKDEVLKYIMDNSIQVEDVDYREVSWDDVALLPKMREYAEEFRQRVEEEGDPDAAYEQMVSDYGDDFALAFYNDEGNLYPTENSDGNISDAARYYLDIDNNPINTTRLEYTTKGLKNKREIALVVPGIEPYHGDYREIHFDDNATGGRALAWARFGDSETGDGERVIVVDEVQSQRFEDAKKRGGLSPVGLQAKIRRFTELERKLYSPDGLTIDEGEELQKMRADGVGAASRTEIVPDAPFEKNWHELAMKRMLRFAAENGYDKLAWTTGDQQAERYALGGVVDEIDSYTNDDGSRHVMINMKNDKALYCDVDGDGKILSTSGHTDGIITVGQSLGDVIGKELAQKVINGEGEITQKWFVDDREVRKLSGEDLRLGAEGMKGFYDEILQRFMNKYGKKWGVKVYDIELPNVEEAGRHMWAVDITPEMKESVMGGQPMFSKEGRRKENKAQLDLFGDPQLDLFRDRRSVNDRIKTMDDGALLRAIGEGERRDWDFYQDEYDRRHDTEYKDEAAAYSDMLEQDGTSLDDAYGMYGNVYRRWVDGGYATEERTKLRAQSDVLADYIYLKEEEEDGGVSFSKEERPEVLESLEKGKTIKVYRAIRVAPDGTLNSPMAGGGVGGGRKAERVGVYMPEFGVWEKADEHPELATYNDGDEYGHITIDKGEGDGTLNVAYNPYIHTSRQMLNDQFSSAWKRPGLQVMEVEVPVSELTSGYKAKLAKNAVGESEWKEGPVSKLLPEGKKRMVILSRWDKPVRIVPVEEYAKAVKAQLDGTDIEGIPFNTVTPEQREALKNEGVKILAPENNNAGKASMQAYEEWKRRNAEVQGFEGYTSGDILDYVRGEIEALLDEADIDVKINGMALNGSRMRGDASKGSDLDVVVEYDGKISEDGLFNILNENPIVLEGVTVDINPITKGKSGTLEQYMERSRKYDEEQGAAFSKEDVDEIEKTILGGSAGQSGTDKTLDGVLLSSRSTHAGNPTLSLNSVAKVQKNTVTAQNTFKKIHNGDSDVDFSAPIKVLIPKIRKRFSMDYAGGTNYGTYSTTRGLLAFRLSMNHNAYGNNFKQDHADENVSVYVAEKEFEFPESEVKFKEFRIKPEDIKRHQKEVFEEVFSALEKAFRTGSYNPECKWLEDVTKSGESKFSKEAPTPKDGEDWKDYAGRVSRWMKYRKEGLADSQIEDLESIRVAIAETDTNPSEAEKKSGNYKMGHAHLDGYQITIENPAGSVRRGTDPDGKAWETKMYYTYGYIRGTKGKDGDHVDIFLSENPTQGNVYVVDQVDPKTGKFDEHKVMYGFGSKEEAREAYLSNYEEGWKGLGDITGVSKEAFRKWVDSSTRKTKPFAEYAGIEKLEEPAFSKEDEKKIVDAAVKHFGITNDIREAGYVLADGRMLDFSGRHLLDPGTDSNFLKGGRTSDHRTISEIAYAYDENGEEVKTGTETSMPDFIRMGNIRIDTNAGTINLSVKPTKEQRDVLRRVIMKNDGDVSVDFGDGWDSDHYAEYEGAKSARVLADIDRYFDEGVKPDGDVQFSKEDFSIKDEKTSENDLQIGEKFVSLHSERDKEAVREQRSSMSPTAQWREGVGDVVMHTILPVVRKKYAELHAKAKAGDREAAAQLVEAVVKEDRVKSLVERYPNAKVAFVHAEEATGTNVIPDAYADAFVKYGLGYADIIQTNKPQHTGSDRIGRLLRRARFDGDVEAGGEYIIVDDHVTMGGTLRDLKDYIESKGGKVVSVTTLTASAGGSKLQPTVEQIEQLKQKGITNEQLKELGIADDIAGLTKGEARELLVLADARADRRDAQGRSGDNGVAQRAQGEASSFGQGVEFSKEEDFAERYSNGSEAKNAQIASGVSKINAIREKFGEESLLSDKDLVSLHTELREPMRRFYEAVSENVANEYVNERYASGRNVIDPDELRARAFAVVGYDGTNVSLYGKNDDLIAKVYRKALAKAIADNNPTVILLTGHAGAGKSTSLRTSGIDTSKAGVVYDSAFNTYESLARAINTAKEAGVKESDIRVVVVYNDPVTSFSNTLARAKKEGRTVPFNYFFGHAFVSNNGKIRDLSDNFPEVNIVCLDNSRNSSKGEVSLDEAKDWDYGVSEQQFEEALKLVEDEINRKERGLTEHQIASIARGLSGTRRLPHRLDGVAKRIEVRLSGNGRRESVGEVGGGLTPDSGVKYSKDSDIKKGKSELWKRTWDEVKGNAHYRDMMLDLEPHTIEEVAAGILRGGGLLWGDIKDSDGKVLVKGVRSFMGYKEGERKKFFGLFTSEENGGRGFERVGEEVETECQRLGIPYDENDPMAGVNALQSVLSECGGKGQLNDYIQYRRVLEVSSQIKADEDAEQEALDEEYYDRYGMDKSTYDQIFDEVSGEKERRKSKETIDLLQRKVEQQNEKMERMWTELKAERTNKEGKAAIERLIQQNKAAREENAALRAELNEKRDDGKKLDNTRIAMERRENIRKQLIDYIREQVASEWMPYTTKQELNKLLSAVQNATTQEGLEKAMLEVRNVSTAGMVRAQQQRLDRMLALKVQGVNGKNMSIAKTVDDRTRVILQGVNQRVMDNKMTGLLERMDDLRRNRMKANAELRRLRRDGDPDGRIPKLEEDLREMESHMAATEQEMEDIRQAKPGTRESDINEELKALEEKTDRAARKEAVWTTEDTDLMTQLKLMQALIEPREFEVQEANIRRQISEKIDLQKATTQERNATADDAKRHELTGKIRQIRSEIEMLKEQRNQAQMARSEALSRVIELFDGVIKGGRDSLQAKMEREAQRRIMLIREAVHSVWGKDPNETTRKGQKDIADATKESAVKRLFSAPMSSFDYMTQKVATDGVGKDSWLYRYFMEGKDGVMEAYNTYLTGMREQKDALNAKVEELFGTKNSKILRTDAWVKQAAEADKMEDHSGVTMVDAYGNRLEMPMSKGQATYIWARWQMADGKVKLQNQGFDDTSIAEIEKFVGPKYIELVKWLSSEFFAGSRAKYNERYREMYNTSMARIENYVPMGIFKGAVRQQSDLSEDAAQRKSLEARAGSLINRKFNVLPVDITQSIFDAISAHVEQMENWYAYARVRRDLDAILSNTYFRNQLNANHAGDFERFYEAAAVATKSYIPGDAKYGDETMAILNKGLVAGNIAFRLNTALKQLLSAPAYLGYSQNPVFIGILAKNCATGMLGENWKWCYDHIPSFRERVNVGDLGDNRLSENTATAIGQWLQKYASIGMIPNRIVDGVTVSIGAKAIHDYALRKNLKLAAVGNPTLEERAQRIQEAHRMAKMEADIFYNQTQQSSHPAFLSPMQLSRSLMDRALTVYQNANLGYTRAMMNAARDLISAADYQRTVNGLARRYESFGLSTEDAMKLARQDAWKKYPNILTRLGLFGWGLKCAWNWGSNGLLGFLQNDDDEKRKDGETQGQYEKRMALRKSNDFISYLLTPVQGTPGGNMLFTAKDYVLGEEGKKFDYNPVLFVDELNKTMMDVSKDIQDGGLLNTMLAAHIMQHTSKLAGIDVQTLGNIYIGVEGLVKDGYPYDDKLIDIMYILNTPRSGRMEAACTLFMEYRPNATEEEFQKVVGYADGFMTHDSWLAKYMPGVKDAEGERYAKEYKTLSGEYQRMQNGPAPEKEESAAVRGRKAYRTYVRYEDIAGDADVENWHQHALNTKKKIGESSKEIRELGLSSSLTKQLIDVEKMDHEYELNIADFYADYNKKRSALIEKLTGDKDSDKDVLADIRRLREDFLSTVKDKDKLADKVWDIKNK